MSKTSLEGGCSPERSGGNGDTLSLVAKVILGVVALAVALPLLIPLVAVIGGIGLGLMGLTLGLVLGVLGLLLKFVLLGLKLVLGLVGMALGLVPFLLIALGVMYLIEKLGGEGATEK